MFKLTIWCQFSQASGQAHVISDFNCLTLKPYLGNSVASYEILPQQYWAQWMATSVFYKLDIFPILSPMTTDYACDYSYLPSLKWILLRRERKICSVSKCSFLSFGFISCYAPPPQGSLISTRCTWGAQTRITDGSISLWGVAWS